LTGAVAAALTLGDAVRFSGELGVFIFEALGPDLYRDFVEGVGLTIVAVFGYSVK
jgi:hypothetical protein